MSQKKYLIITEAVFLTVALLHLGRVVFSFPLVIGTYDAPLWLSAAVALLAGSLSWEAFKLHRR